MPIFFAGFSWFSRNNTLQRAELFLCCLQWIKSQDHSFKLSKSTVVLYYITDIKRGTMHLSVMQLISNATYHCNSTSPHYQKSCYKAKGFISGLSGWYFLSFQDVSGGDEISALSGPHGELHLVEPDTDVSLCPSILETANMLKDFTWPGDNRHVTRQMLLTWSWGRKQFI